MPRLTHCSEGRLYRYSLTITLLPVPVGPTTSAGLPQRTATSSRYEYLQQYSCPVWQYSATVHGVRRAQ